MTAWKITTLVLLLTGVGVWVAWDIVVAMNGIPGDTISEMTLAAAQAAPVLAVVLGVVVGHLFGVFAWLQPALVWLGQRPLIAFVWGLATGLLFWNQRR